MNYISGPHKGPKRPNLHSYSISTKTKSNVNFCAKTTPLNYAELPCDLHPKNNKVDAKFQAFSIIQLNKNFFVQLHRMQELFCKNRTNFDFFSLRTQTGKQIHCEFGAYLIEQGGSMIACLRR